MRRPNRPSTLVTMLLTAACNEAPSAPPDAWTAGDPGITVGDDDDDDDDDDANAPLDVGTPGEATLRRAAGRSTSCS